MKKMLHAAIASTLFSSLLASARPAFAHSIAVWAEVAGNKVKVEATWSDGKPAKNSRVEVKGTDGKLLLAGRTDDKGRFEFAPPAKVDLTIRVVAGGHHEATASVKAADLPDVTLPEKPWKQQPSRSAHPKQGPEP